MFKIKSTWHIECVARSGELKWEESVGNIVVNEGLTSILETVFNGSAYTADWYMGLKDVGTPVSSDTLDNHPSWAELTDYVGDRKAVPFNPATLASIDNNNIRPVFDITVDDTIYGMFITDQETGTVGLLLSIINFTSPRDVVIGDELRVAVTYNIQGV